MSAPPSAAGVRRPIGWAPGTGTLIGAWAVGAAIARLTGATAVVLVLVAVFVGAVFEFAAGWRAARLPGGIRAVGPSVVTVDEPTHVSLTFERADRRLPGGSTRDRRIVVRTPDGTAVTSVDLTSRATSASAPATFSTAGVVDRLLVAVEVTGPAGLLWWRRGHVVEVERVHVAPAPDDRPLPIERATTTVSGTASGGAATAAGDIDGVRPWRRGDAVTAVHWPSSLRSDELIVHDRVAASDERWVVDLACDAAVRDDGSRLCRTLEDGVRQGHRVTVVDLDRNEHEVVSDEDGRRWAAVTAARFRELERRPRGRATRSFLRQPIRLTRPELSGVDPIARTSAGAAALAAIAMLVGALDTARWVVALAGVGIVAGVVVSLRVAARTGERPVWMRVGVAVAVALALGAIAVDASGVSGLLEALRGPLPNLLMLLVVLHGFEVVDRRTLRVHQAIALVVAAYAAGLRIDGALGWWLSAWGGAWAVSVLTTTRRPAPGDDEQPAARKPALAAVSVVPVVAWASAFVVIAIAVLAVIPVPDGPARLGLPALSNDAPTADRPGALVGADGSPIPPADPDDRADRGKVGEVVGYPGFTETLDTSVRGTLPDDVVMRVRAPEPAFWRGQTFADFDGRVWSAAPDTGVPRVGPAIDVPPTVGDAMGSAVGREELVQTYFVEQDLPNVVFAAYRPDQVIFDGTLWTRPDGALRSDVTLTAGSVYTVVSDRLQVTPEVLRGQGDLGEFFAGFVAQAGDADVAPFLQLPASTTRRTIDLATSLRGDTTYDTILAYQAWLGANTEYDLDAPVPAAGVDAVDDFLFGSRRGFCEQIASALTIMLRTQGVPARLATGYVPGERDRVSGVWKVRGSDAHAWVEVWFPQTGWEAFDPTADVPLAGETDPGTIGGDLLGAVADSVASHRVEIGAGALLLLGAWSAVAVAARARRRRLRGRWGLLQDRFTALPGPAGTGAAEHPAPRTNPTIARSISADEEVGPAAARVAALLDQASFDPDWVDDDATYDEARRLVTSLEGRRRG